MNKFTQGDFINLVEKLKKASGKYSSIQISFDAHNHNKKAIIKYLIYIENVGHTTCTSLRDLIEKVNAKIDELSKIAGEKS
jgi:hypothetical protein